MGALFLLFRIILPLCLALVMFGLSIEGFIHLTGWPAWASIPIVTLLLPTGGPIVALAAYDLIAVYNIAWYWVALGIFGPGIIVLLGALAVTWAEKD